jgi:hypothetical protein
MVAIYATLLKDVLEDMGMHTELISYTCKCKVGPEGPIGCMFARQNIPMFEESCTLLQLV